MRDFLSIQGATQIPKTVGGTNHGIWHCHGITDHKVSLYPLDCKFGTKAIFSIILVF